MKKIATILFSVTFSIFILLIGVGVNIVKCNHTGKYKIHAAIFTVDKNFCETANSQDAFMLRSAEELYIYKSIKILNINKL